MMKLIDFPGGYDSHVVRPKISADAEPHYEALTRGELLLQRCKACDHARFPAMPICTWCGSESSAWIAATGSGQVHSWVRYHRAYLPEFEALLPYVVLAVRLDEGPVLFGRLVSSESPPSGQRSTEAPSTPRIGQAARGVVERWADGFCGLAFELPETVA